jgi:hypothetical protein
MPGRGHPVNSPEAQKTRPAEAGLYEAAVSRVESTYEDANLRPVCHDAMNGLHGRGVWPDRHEFNGCGIRLVKGLPV